jgi:hypothetical protein
MERDPERRKTLMDLSTNLQARADSRRDLANNALASLPDLQTAIQFIGKDAEDRITAMHESLQALMKQAEETAAAWRQRAQEARDEADALEASVGGALQAPEVKGLAAVWQGIRRLLVGDSKGLDVRGQPLPRWDRRRKLVTDEGDVDAAISIWNANPNLPPEAHGILTPRAPTLSELVDADRHPPKED